MAGSLRSAHRGFHSYYSLNGPIQRAAAALKNAQYLIIAAGPGLDVSDVNRGSVEMLPDYRRLGKCDAPATRKWWLKHYPHLAKDRIFPSCDTNFFPDPELFQKQPHLAWGFWGQLFGTEAGSNSRATTHGIPNHMLTQNNIWAYQIMWKWVTQAKNSAVAENISGNGKLGDIAQTLDQKRNLNNLESWSIFTSNVDGQFQKYGFDDSRIMECHGNLHFLQCSKRCSDNVWPVSEVANPFLEDVCSEPWSPTDAFELAKDRPKEVKNYLPTCQKCGAIARPSVKMGQNNDSGVVEDHAWISSRMETQLNNFRADLEKVVHVDKDRSCKKNVVIIEVGGGKNCRDVTKFSEKMLTSNQESIDATLIRISSFRDDQLQNIQPHLQQQTISIDGQGVFEPLFQIDRAMSLMEVYTENRDELQEWLERKKSEYQRQEYAKM